MTKLTELAELLKSAKKPKPVVEEQTKVVEQVELPPKEPQPDPEPVVEAPVPALKSVGQAYPTMLEMMQKEINLMKKMISESKQTAIKPMYGYSGGGGSSSASDIDRPTKTVTSDYSLTTRDWYVGVNHTVPVSMYLPTAIKNGREYVIKDETGYANLVPIKIVGVIDNNPDGIELRVANASVTLLYNNGWRII